MLVCVIFMYAFAFCDSGCLLPCHVYMTFCVTPIVHMSGILCVQERLIFLMCTPWLCVFFFFFVCVYVIKKFFLWHSDCQMCLTSS